MIERFVSPFRRQYRIPPEHEAKRLNLKAMAESEVFVSKILEVRVKVPDSTPDEALKQFGEHLQDMLPPEFEEMPEYFEEFDNLTFEVEDVTFEIKAL